MFPPIFCIADDDSETVSVFHSQQIRPRAYVITPYTIFHGSTGSAAPEDAYILSGRFGGNRPLDTHVCLLAEISEIGPRRTIYTGNWQHTGKTVFSMYCGATIPVLAFPEATAIDFHWATTNKLPVINGTRGIVRLWVRRWNPSSWFHEISTEISPRGGSPVLRADTQLGLVAQTSGVHLTGQAFQPIPKYVADLLIRDAENRNAICPITMEPIESATATATPCFHVFNAAALAAWTTSGNNTCPECRSRISTTAT